MIMNKSRHATTVINCEVCGKEKEVRTQRVKQGMGRFCSKICFDIHQRQVKKETVWGRKDLAKSYNMGGKIGVRWYDENGKTKSSTFAKWWWEINVGEVPDGMIVLHKDNNPLNIDPSNFELGTKSDALVKANATRKADTRNWNKYIKKSSDRQTQKWEDGDFDHLKGSGHYNWKGGTHWDKYPNEFYEIRPTAIERDKGTCQICGIVPKKIHVHHIDGDKNNNNLDNLISFCTGCHNRVHSSKNPSPVISAFQSKLKY
jgi:hypothetical protein